MPLTHPQETWKWFGHPGHFCAGHYCWFHICTQIGDKWISTVGDYHPPHKTERDGPERIGAGADDYYETMVFNVLEGTKCTDEECGCGMPHLDLGELECTRYKLAGEAMRGHLETCLKYAK